MPCPENLIHRKRSPFHCQGKAKQVIPQLLSPSPERGGGRGVRFAGEMSPPFPTKKEIKPISPARSNCSPGESVL